MKLNRETSLSLYLSQKLGKVYEFPFFPFSIQKLTRDKLLLSSLGPDPVQVKSRWLQGHFKLNHYLKSQGLDQELTL